MSKYSSTKHDKVSDSMFGNMSTAMSEYVSNKCRIECQNMPDKVSKFMSENIPAVFCAIACQNIYQRNVTFNMSDTMPDKTSKSM